MSPNHQQSPPTTALALGGCVAVGALMAASPALAHAGHVHSATFQAGLLHPVGGLDHLLAMVAVGLWAAWRGDRALWAWPAAFVAAMLGGGLVGLAGVQLPLIEPAILASVIALGVLTAAAARAPVLAGAVVVALFGLTHGYAHGAEAPAGSAGSYLLGFTITTAALHLAGLAAGLGLLRLKQPLLVRVAGAGAALGGLMLVLA